jgi:hypothetical protein
LKTVFKGILEENICHFEGLGEIWRGGVCGGGGWGEELKCEIVRFVCRCVLGLV